MTSSKQRETLTPVHFSCAYHPPAVFYSQVLAFSDTPDGAYGKTFSDTTSALSVRDDGEARDADDDEEVRQGVLSANCTIQECGGSGVNGEGEDRLARVKCSTKPQNHARFCNHEVYLLFCVQELSL